MNVSTSMAGWSAGGQTVSDRSISPETKGGRRQRWLMRGDTRSIWVEQADQAYIALRDTAEEASRSNWDGYGASPVSDATVAQGLAFLDLLPSTVPPPEVSAHPDGELAFEWRRGPGRVLTVSVNETGRLSYAAMFGEARQHGTEYLLDAVPDSLFQALRRLYAHG